ncbi:MAG: HAD-IA family hydrolase [Clostridia bacterium]|nr:HAD-IA family hydrolase [Clostridia bacterium]
MIRNILFDLDGTITDSKEGIIKSAQYALEKLGIEPPAFSDMFWVIGPPIRKSFAEKFDLDEETAFRGLRFYQERFGDVGYLENEVYDGVPEMLKTLKDEGYRLFITTSKPTVYTDAILKHFGLYDLFEYVSGSDLDGTRGSKADVIRTVMVEYGLKGSETVIVGDRLHDIAGGKETGIFTMGVRYGYADEGELESAGADWIAETPMDIVRIVEES